MRWVPRQRRVLIATTAVLVLAVVGFMLPHGVRALTPAEVIGNWIASLIFWVIQLLANLLVVIINIMVAVAQYNDFLGAPAVVRGWAIVRDVANMFFIVVLLIIAFGTILRLENYRYNRLLARLIVMAVLVNFSKFIAGFFIDFAQVIMLTFVNAWRDAAAGNITTALGLKDIVSISGAGGFVPAEDANIGAILTALLLGLALMIIAVIVMAVIAVVLLLRIFALWFLVVLSPLAYVLRTYPTTERYAARWWQEFGKYVSCGPVVAFLLWLSLAIMATPNQFSDVVFKKKDVVRTEERGGVVTESLGSSSGTSAEISAAISTIGRSDRLLSYLTGIILLVGSLVVAKEVCGAGGQLAGQWAEKIKKAGARAATIGGATFAFGPAGFAAAKWGAQAAQLAGKGLKAAPAAFGRQMDKGFITAQRKGKILGVPLGTKAFRERLRARPVSLRPSMIKQSLGDVWKRKDDAFYRGVAGGMYDNFRSPLGMLGGKYKTNRAYAEKQALTAKYIGDRKDLANRSELMIPELQSLVKRGKKKPDGTYNWSVAPEDIPQVQAFLQTLVANKFTKDLLTSEHVGEVTGSRENTPLNLTRYIAKVFGDDTDARDFATSLGSTAFGNQQRRFAAQTYLNDQREWQLNTPEDLAANAGYNWGEMQQFAPSADYGSWDQFKAAHKGDEETLRGYQDYWHDKYIKDSTALITLMQGVQTPNDLVRSMDPGGLFTTRGVSRNNTVTERSVSDEGMSNLLNNYVNATSWGTLPTKIQTDLLKKIDVLQAVGDSGSSDPRRKQEAKERYARLTGRALTQEITEQQQVGIYRLIANLMRAGGQQFDRKAAEYRQNDGNYDSLGDVLRQMESQEGYDTYGEYESYEYQELTKPETLAALEAAPTKDEEEKIVDEAKQAAVAAYNAAHAGNIAAGRTKPLEKPPKIQPAVQNLPTWKDRGRVARGRPTPSEETESPDERATREAMVEAIAARTEGRTDFDEAARRRELKAKYEEEEDDELGDLEDPDLDELRDVDHRKVMRTRAKVAEYGATGKDFFDSDEYRGQSDAYLTSAQHALAERLEFGEQNAVGGIAGLARGRRTVLIDGSTFAGGRFAHLAGGYITDPQVKEDFAREYVGLIDQEMGTVQSQLAQAGTDREKAGFQARLDMLQKARERLSDPAGLKDLKFVNSARLGYSPRHVVAHEETHAKLDELDPSGAFRENMMSSMAPEQLQTIVRQMRAKMQDESLSDTDAFNEYLAEGLTNAWDSWADTSPDAVKLDQGMLLRIQQQAKKEKKPLFMQAGPELDEFQRRGGNPLDYAGALGYAGAAKAKRFATGLLDSLKYTGTSLWQTRIAPTAGMAAQAIGASPVGRGAKALAESARATWQTRVAPAAGMAAQAAAAVTKPLRGMAKAAAETTTATVAKAGQAFQQRNLTKLASQKQRLDRLRETADQKLKLRDEAILERNRARDAEKLRRLESAQSDERYEREIKELAGQREAAKRSGNLKEYGRLDGEIRDREKMRSGARILAVEATGKRKLAEQRVEDLDLDYRKAKAAADREAAGADPEALAIAGRYATAQATQAQARSAVATRQSEVEAAQLRESELKASRDAQARAGAVRLDEINKTLSRPDRRRTPQEERGMRDEQRRLTQQLKSFDAQLSGLEGQTDAAKKKLAEAEAAAAVADSSIEAIVREADAHAQRPKLVTAAPTKATPTATAAGESTTAAARAATEAATKAATAAATSAARSASPARPVPPPPSRPTAAEAAAVPESAEPSGFDPAAAQAQFEEMIRMGTEEFANSMKQAATQIDQAVAHIQERDRKTGDDLRRRIDDLRGGTRPERGIQREGVGDFEMKRYLRELSTAIRRANEKKTPGGTLPKPPRSTGEAA